MYEVRLSWGRGERMPVIICNSHAYYYPPLFTKESKCASNAVITTQFHKKQQKSPPWFNQGGTPFWPKLMFKQSNRNSNPSGESQDREGVSGLDLKYGERDRGRFLSQIPALYHLNLTSPTLTTQRICVSTFFFFSHGITFVPFRAADARQQQQSAGEKSFALLINTFFNRHTIISIVNHSNTDCDLMKRSESASVTFVLYLSPVQQMKNEKKVFQCPWMMQTVTG